MSRRLARFELVITDAGPHLRVVGGNGEPVSSTQLYRPGPSAARHAIKVIGGAGDDARGLTVDERTAAPGGGTS